MGVYQLIDTRNGKIYIGSAVFNVTLSIICDIKRNRTYKYIMNKDSGMIGKN